VLERQLDITAAKDPGVLSYEIFRDSGGNYCQHERYEDEAALMLHIQNTAAELAEWSEVTELSDTIVLGPVSDEFLNSETAAGAVRYLPFKQVTR
jgi:quinol monooxygenase YgiN